MKIKTNAQKIKEFLNRGVEKAYPSREALVKILKSGKKIRLYSGIDPTGQLHLGHLALFNKLRQALDLGHEVIILIGDFTATIGDPTDKMAARKPLTRKQVLKNSKNYRAQAGKILGSKRANLKFLHNEKWTNKLKPADLLRIFSCFTVARLLERDMFQKRIEEGKDILLHEFVYPVFQAYDSVAMDVDLEIGGNDQTFNMLRGRDLMKKMRKNKEKFVISLKLLVDPGGRKMGKTEGNFVSLSDSPKEMFGKIMSWPDSLLEKGFEILTSLPEEKTEKIKKALELQKLNPREAKAELAKEIVKTCHSLAAAEKEKEEFDRVFKEKKLPSKMPEIGIKEKSLNVLDLLVKIKLTRSRAEARRLILQKGVKIGGKIEDDWKKEIEIKKGLTVQVGKKRFARLI